MDVNNHDYTQFLLRNLESVPDPDFMPKTTPRFFRYSRKYHRRRDRTIPRWFNPDREYQKKSQILWIHNKSMNCTIIPEYLCGCLSSYFFLYSVWLLTYFSTNFIKRGYHTIIKSDARVIPSLSMCSSILSQTHRQYPFVHWCDTDLPHHCPNCQYHLLHVLIRRCRLRFSAAMEVLPDALHFPTLLTYMGDRTIQTFRRMHET